MHGVNNNTRKYYWGILGLGLSLGSAFVLPMGSARHRPHMGFVSPLVLGVHKK